MKVTMDMVSYEIERDTAEVEYGDEILFAGWNPEVDIVCQQTELESISEQLNMPPSVAVEVVDTFLKKMYSYQR